jgi:hypothetical protein
VTTWAAIPGLVTPGTCWPGNPGAVSSPAGPPVLLNAAAGPPSAGWVSVTGSTDLIVPLYGLAGVDLTQVAVEFALIDEANGEPGSADWKLATWTGVPYPGEPSAAGAWLLVIAGEFAAMAGMLWVQLTHTASSEQPVMQSGRIRVGTGGS